ncbi:hypothetical protein D9758_017911 [Tetrapyrgos nigripes]|uniref:Uncharacterized protein n=1 Tax=Tetrapyrgos nigripes TaxID=182062 RepID=A0A8H5C241_9AGAR|nr:hypothetical protein D9758_017911 [Tetrapyrgos nigripes]
MILQQWLEDASYRQELVVQNSACMHWRRTTQRRSRLVSQLEPLVNALGNGQGSAPAKDSS